MQGLVSPFRRKHALPFTCVALAVVLLAAAAGCARKKQITDLERKKAALRMSEAQFAMTLRNWKEAEAGLREAVAEAPDTGATWIALGSVRMKLGDRAGAKAAYQGALSAFEDAAEARDADTDPWLQQVYALALLGRGEEARARLEKISRKFPDDRAVRSFVDGNQLDRMLADPQFKEIAL